VFYNLRSYLVSTSTVCASEKGPNLQRLLAQETTFNLPNTTFTSIKLTAHAQISRFHYRHGAITDNIDTDGLTNAAAQMAEKYLAIGSRSSLVVEVRIVHPEDTWVAMNDMPKVYSTKYLRYRETPVVRQLIVDEENTNCCSATPCAHCARFRVY
jgi:hypothetical protein